MMRMLMEMVLGFLVLQAAASPRFARQVELDTYDSANYDVDLENLNPDNQDIYDYEDGLTIDEPQIEIGTLAPPDYNYPAPGASLEEEEEEEQEEGLEEEEQEEDQEEGQEEEEQEEGQEEEEQEEGQEEEEQEEEELEEAQEEEELEEAQEEEELEEGQEEEEEQEEEQEIQLKVEEEVQLKPKLIPQGSGDSGILMGPDTQKEEELRLAPIDILHVSGDFGGSVGSGASGESGSSGDLLGSGDLLSSGDLLGSGGSGGSGDLGSGGSGASGASGDILGSGESGDILGSGGSGITMISGEEELILEKIPQEASGDEESGASGDPSASGEAGEPSASGEAGEPSASGEAGEPSASGEAGEPSASGEAGEPSASGEAGEPSASGEDVSGVSAESGVSGEEEGEPIIPIIDKEEELLPATPSPEETEGEIISGASGLEPDFKGMPTCLLCTCLGGSVYCDDLKLSHVPPLPKDTTHFYARYNKITKINKSDFAEMNKLKRIDVTANEISSVADGAFTGLPVLEELIIRENAVAQLPALPVTMTLVDASHNNIGATGIHKEAFKDMAGLLYLYLTDNHIDHIPVPLPDSLRSLHLQRNNIQMMHEDTFCNLKDFNYIRNALEDIRLDGNPLNLSRTPQAYVCLPRVPVGDLI